MRFLFVRPEICPWVSRFPTSGFLQIPPHDGHPCLRLYPSHYRADSGLSPVRNVRRQAHRFKSCTSEKHHLRAALFCYPVTVISASSLRSASEALPSVRIFLPSSSDQQGSLPLQPGLPSAQLSYPQPPPYAYDELLPAQFSP